MDEDDDSNFLPSGDDDGGDQSQGFLQSVEDAWSSIWSMSPMLLAETDPFSAFTLGDGIEPADGPTVQGGQLLTGTLSTLKDDTLEAAGVNPAIPLWAYGLFIILVLFLVAYTAREVAG